MRRVLLLGPAFIAAVAYVDPGNVATNITAGAEFGYTLVWVVVVANLMAVVVQYLSAKLGLVTQQSLAGHVAQSVNRPVRLAYWGQAEVIAIATDLAEVVGGAVALRLIFGLPLWLGAIVTALVAMVVLAVGDWRGQRALERIIESFLLLIGVGFVAGLFVVPPDPAAVAAGLVPSFHGSGSMVLTAGIIGATVMPHVIYLHSQLTVDRLGPRGASRSMPQLLATTRIDVGLALLLAGALNLSLLLLAASGLAGMPGADTLEGVYALIDSQLGHGIALLFAVALLGSGFASTSVGSAAGAEVMASLTSMRVPAWLRRVVTLIPALAVLLLGFEPTKVLVWSQVVLSFGVPFAIVPLVWFTSSRRVMGAYANRPLLTVLASGVAALIIVVNAGVLLL